MADKTSGALGTKAQVKTSAAKGGKAAAAAPKAENHTFAFGKENYILMLVGLAIISLGFFLMAGSEDIFSTTKLTVAPILVLGGFAFEIYAIMRKAKD
jgi:hypothetical protein